ncbi:MAG: SEC-C domain-containing protein [Streptococcaceae bacterium]|nr:SEC-C domain-containing protein [Streptococcaceae bacterium]
MWFYICADPFPTIERNQRCGCGSGKKYKKCCYHTRWKQVIAKCLFKIMSLHGRLKAQTFLKDVIDTYFRILKCVIDAYFRKV